MDLATVFRQSLDLWQNPPDTELSEEAFLGCANRVITQRGLDLDLTADAAFSTVTSETFYFDSADSREHSLADVMDDISRIVRVESRMLNSTNEDDWGEETRTSYDNWNEIVERGDGDFVTFFSNEDGHSIVVARDVSNLEFRIVYRKLRDKIVTLGEIVDLPSIYEPVLVYDIALEMGEIIDNQSDEFRKKKGDKMPYLLGRLQDAEKRIEKWRKSQLGAKTTHRRAFNNRSGGLNIRRRRFSVTWPG